MVWSADELVVPGAGGGLRFGGAQRREVLAGVAAAQLSVGGDGLGSGAQAGQAGVPGGSGIGAAATGSGPIGSAGSG
jgi:hypothetical protein